MAVTGPNIVRARARAAASGLFLTGQFVTHDEVVNDLTTGGAVVPLSAEQGKILAEREASPDPVTLFETALT